MVPRAAFASLISLPTAVAASSVSAVSMRSRKSSANASMLAADSCALWVVVTLSPLISARLTRFCAAAESASPSLVAGTGEPVDSQAGRWIDLRLEMPESSAYNQKRLAATAMIKDQPAEAIKAAENMDLSKYPGNQ